MDNPTPYDAEAASERRRRFQLFAAHGVNVERNPYTPPAPITAGQSA